jgi:CDI immunity proteins
MTEPSFTLEQLDGENWGEPNYNSYLVRTVHALRRNPIAEFTVEDLRIMLGQQRGVEHLTPIALSRLEANPFAEGHFYPGDLLAAVMALPREYWSAHASEARRMDAIARQVASEIEGHMETEDIKSHLAKLLNLAAWRAG